MAEETTIQETKKEITAKELAEQVSEIAGVDPRELPNAFIFIDAGKQVWTHGKPPPMPTYAKSLVIFAMFHGDGDVRVYCAPVVSEVGYTRFVLSRTSQTLVADTMTLEVFKETVADEIRAAFGVARGAELELELVTGYLDTLPGDYPLSEVKADLEALVHRQLGDEDDEGEAAPADPPNGMTAPAPPPDAPPPS